VLLRVEGNRLATLSENGRAFTQQSTAKTIDLSTATCLPGLIDVHVHLIDQDAQRRELQTPSKSLSAESLMRTLRYGFTTVRNLGTDGLGPSDIVVRWLFGRAAAEPREQWDGHWKFEIARKLLL
jgi:imidazolonepropionase-like amidohydrolase